MDSINEAGAIQLAESAPTQITTLAECEQGVEWLRAKREWDAAVDAAHSESIKAANKAHKAALSVVKALKSASDTIATNIRSRIEAYAENHSAALPTGVYRRKKFMVTIINPEDVPIQFRSPDAKMIEDYVKRTDNTIKIPGVSVVEETAVTIRAEG